jgi:hypothetical protein
MWVHFVHNTPFLSRNNNKFTKLTQNFDTKIYNLQNFKFLHHDNDFNNYFDKQ